MTNIPKKLDINTFTPDEFVGKINELIDYLEANQTKEKSYKAASSVCCDSSFRLEGDTKEGTMYHVCNNCNKACDIKLTEKKVKASKGECFCSYYDWNRGTPNEKCMVHNPPEHEESWDSTYLFHPDNHSLDSEPTESDKNMQWDSGEDWIIKLHMLSHQIKAGEKKWVDVENYIRDNFVSKEKIKRAIEEAADCVPGTRGRTLDAISKSLGLGD